MTTNLSSNFSKPEVGIHPVQSPQVYKVIGKIGISIQNGINKILDIVMPRNPVTQHREFRFIPTAIENVIGAIYYDDLCPRSKISSPSATTETVKKVFNDLVKQCVRNKELAFEVRVMEDERTVNAFCLPGGKVVITTAMIKKFQENSSIALSVSQEEREQLAAITFEDKLAAVLGHEISHACAGHGRRALQLKLIFFLTLKVATFALGYFIKSKEADEIEKEKQKRLRDRNPMTATEESALRNQVESKVTAFSKFGDFISNVIKFFSAQSYSRCHELEADKYGIKVAKKAGYREEGAIWMQHKFMEMKGEKEGVKQSWFMRTFSKSIDLFSTHPPSLERLQANRITVATIKREGVDAIYPTV